MRKGILFLVLAALLLVSAGLVLAQDGDDDGLISVYTEDYGHIAMFTDGRLNAFDLAAPVAIYYTKHNELRPNAPTISVVDGIEVLAINPVTRNGELALHLTNEEIRNLVEQAGDVDCSCLIERNGYSLHYSRSGWFWVETPPDREGKVYTYTWEDTQINAS
jgi:hypothetical protein